MMETKLQPLFVIQITTLLFTGNLDVYMTSLSWLGCLCA